VAEQKGETNKSQGVFALDLSTALPKLLKALERVLARFISGKVITLDISQTSVRIMETRGGVVRRWAEVSFESEEAKNMAQRGEPALGAALRQLMESSGIKAKKVIASISALYTVSRLIPVHNLPPAPTLDESVKEIAQEIMPVATEELYFFWQAVSADEGEQQILTVGVPRDVMDDEIRALKTAGINPQIIELKAMALTRVVHKEEAVILNIEPTNFDIIMVVKGVPEIMHSLAWRQGDMSIEDAAEYLATNLEVTVDFYNAHHLDAPFDTDIPLYITGQMSVEPQLMGKLQDRLAFNIEPLTPPLDCPDFLPISQYAVNIGLAMRKEMSVRDTGGGAGFLPLDMNLLPQAYRPWRPTAKQLYSVIILIAAVILIFPLWEVTADTMHKTSALERKSEILDTQLQMKMMEIQRRDPLQKAINEYNSIIARSGSFKEDIMVIVGEAEKLEVEVSSLSHGKNEININCSAKDYLSFRAYLTVLEESGRFATPIPPPEGYPYTRGGSIKLKTQTDK